MTAGTHPGAGWSAPTAAVIRFVLVLCSSVFLSWSVALLRPASFVTLAGAPVHHQISTLEPTPGDEPAEVVRVQQVFADGRLIQSEAIDRSGGWRIEGWALVDDGDGKPASLDLDGRRVTVVFDASGAVRIAGANGTSRDVDLSDVSTDGISIVDLADGVITADHDERSALVPTLLLVLVVVLGMAAVWKPWRTEARFEAWVVLYVAGLHMLTWLTQGIGLNSDLPGYLDGASAFLSGDASYFPPGYSIFIVIIGAIVPGATGLGVTAVQHGMMVVSLWWLYRVSRRFLPIELASVGLLLAGSVAPTILLPQAFFSENLALFGMAGTLWALSANASTGRDRWAGALAGLATLTRVVPLGALALPVVLLQATRGGTVREMVGRTARTAVAGLLVVGGAAVWLFVHGGSFSLSTGADLHLYNRVITEQYLLDQQGPATKRLLALAPGRPSLQGIPHWDIRPILVEHGAENDYAQLTQLLGDAAREGMWSHPVEFSVYSVQMAWREYQAGAVPSIPAGASDVTEPLIENEPLSGVDSTSLLWRRALEEQFRAAWPLLSWAPILALLVVHRLRAPMTFLAVLAVPAGYLLATATIEYFLERYVVCVLPFALILVPVPFGVALESIRKSYRSRSS